MFGKTTSYQKLRECLVELGYIEVHTWYESHGNGCQVTFQLEVPSGCSMSNLQVLCLNREGQVEQILGNVPFKDYLSAQEIQRALKDPGLYHETWTMVGKVQVSPCCTASWFDVRNDWNDLYRIHSIAGHGEWAEKIKKENKS